MTDESITTCRPCSFIHDDLEDASNSELSVYGGFLKWWDFPPNYPLRNRVFHDFHHPFWGFPTILGNTQKGTLANLHSSRLMVSWSWCFMTKSLKCEFQGRLPIWPNLEKDLAKKVDCKWNDPNRFPRLSSSLCDILFGGTVTVLKGQKV